MSLKRIRTLLLILYAALNYYPLLALYTRSEEIDNKLSFIREIA